MVGAGCRLVALHGSQHLQTALDTALMHLGGLNGSNMDYTIESKQLVGEDTFAWCSVSAAPAPPDPGRVRGGQSSTTEGSWPAAWGNSSRYQNSAQGAEGAVGFRNVVHMGGNEWGPDNMVFQFMPTHHITLVAKMMNEPGGGSALCHADLWVRALTVSQPLGRGAQPAA